MRLNIRGTVQKAALAALASRCGADHSCTVSNGQLALEAGTALDRLRVALRELRHRGLVSVFEQRRADGGRDANRFVLHGPWDGWGGSGVPFPEIAACRPASADDSAVTR
ncbi:hypothetical protein GXW82_44540 [Streptacidiphilus sp. 4-A2]|nr:hypothetical protein [Streptacidiphilus sp. 4-A2]